MAVTLTKQKNFLNIVGCVASLKEAFGPHVSLYEMCELVSVIFPTRVDLIGGMVLSKISRKSIHMLAYRRNF